MAGQTINVSILADTRQFSTAMKKLSDTTGLTKLGNSFKSAGQKITGFLKGGIKWTAAFTAGVAALALKGGLARAMNIEDARAQLGALGHDTKAIDGIMKNALASVKGTAFGLGDAATLAGQAVAAGVKPGQDLERQLKLVTNTAALAKTGMGEMGSIFQKVWTAGKVGTEELNQLADRGIPIWTKLQDHYKVSADELRKMVSKGKVDAETFARVLEGTVGPAAAAMGDTTRGAFENMKAALSRTGEAFLKGVFPMFKEGMTGITGFLDSLTPVAERAGVAFGAAVQWITRKIKDLVGYLESSGVARKAGAIWTELTGGFRAFASSWKANDGDITSSGFPGFMEQLGYKARQTFDYFKDTVVPTLQDFADWVDIHKDKLAGILAVIGGFLGGLVLFGQVLGIVKAIGGVLTALGIVMAANPIGLAVAAIAAVAAGLAWFFTQTELGKEVWGKIWTFIQDTVAAAADWFTSTAVPALEDGWQAIQDAAKVVADWFTTTAVPALQDAWTAISDAATAAADWYMTHVAPVFDAAGEFIAEVASQMSQSFQDAWTAIQAVWDVIGGPVMAVIEQVAKDLQIVWETVWKAFEAIVDWAWKSIKSQVETALANLESTIRIATAFMRGDWDTIWSEMGEIIERSWAQMKRDVANSINALNSIIITVITAIVQWASGAWEAMKTKAVQAWQRLNSAIFAKGAELLMWFGRLPGRIVNAVGDLSNVLSRAGKQLMNGFLDSIGLGFMAVQGKLQRMTAQIPQWKGPPAKDRNLLRGAGSLVMQGFIDGLESKYDRVRNSLTGLTRDVATTTFDPMAAPQLSLATHPDVARGGTSAGLNVESSPIEHHYHFAPGAFVISGLTAVAAAEDLALRLQTALLQRGALARG